MNCVCGKELEVDSKFCPECGRPVTVAGPVSEPVDTGADSSVTVSGETDRREDPVGKTLRRDGGGYGQGSPEHLPEGFIIDNRFEIKHKLGQGGFGAVYLVHDHRLEIEKALKVLPSHMAYDPDAVEDLRNETKKTVRLNHPGIVRVYNYHEEGFLKYIEMEFVEGTNLANKKRETGNRRLPEQEVIRYGIEICKALEYAHSQDVIHRDIKPHNIMVTPENTIKLMDFGIAETIRTSASRSAHSSSSGTEVYMSPEQLIGRDVGRESDIYSMGVTMYELLSGNPPFYRGNIAYQIETKEPAPLEGVSVWLNDVLLKCLAKDYRDRYRSAAELRSDLESRIFAGGSGVEAALVDGAGGDGIAESGPPVDGNPPGRAVPTDSEIGGDGGKPGIGRAGDPAELPAGPVSRSKASRRVLMVIPVIVVLALLAWGAVELLKPRMIAVPDVRGMSKERAESLLEDSGIRIGKEYKVKTKSQRDKTVQSIRPAPGSEVKKGSEVELDVYDLWVTVPNVTNLPRERAASALKKAGLSVETSRNEYHPSIPSGKVIDIEGGPSELRAGSAVTLLLSKGIHMIEVPQLAGTTFDKAKRILADTGFILGKVDRKLSRGYGEAGIVLTSRPSSGESPEGSPVSLVVSLAGTSVPNVRGLDVGTIKERLSSSGLKSGKQETRYSDSVSEGKVIDTSPSASSWLEKGSLVRLVVSGLPEKYRNSAGASMVLIEPGVFKMGSPSSEPGHDSDEKQHEVTISKPYYMGATEVTQGQWRDVIGSNPSFFKGDNLPVEKVSWLDAVKYCNKLSEKEGLTSTYKINGESVTWTRSANGYRLPTEAEWEYACRGGTTTPFYTGRCLSADEANYNGGYPQEGCSKGRDIKKTLPVGSFDPNVWGLYDMHGNVWEWCWDWYDKDYPGGSVTDPVNPGGGSNRVNRGGSWYYYARFCRSALRLRDSPDYTYYSLGFRLVRSAS